MVGPRASVAEPSRLCALVVPLCDQPPARALSRTAPATVRRVKKRLDVLLVERGLADTRAKAQALVLAGRVPGHSKAVARYRSTRSSLCSRAHATSRAAETELAGALEDLDIGCSRARLRRHRCVDRRLHRLLTRGRSGTSGRDRRRYGHSTRACATTRASTCSSGPTRALSRPAGCPLAPALITCDVSFTAFDWVVPPVVASARAAWRALVLLKPSSKPAESSSAREASSVTRRCIARCSLTRAPGSRAWLGPARARAGACTGSQGQSRVLSRCSLTAASTRTRSTWTRRSRGCSARERTDRALRPAPHRRHLGRSCGGRRAPAPAASRRAEALGVEVIEVEAPGRPGADPDVDLAIALGVTHDAARLTPVSRHRRSGARRQLRQDRFLTSIPGDALEPGLDRALTGQLNVVDLRRSRRRSTDLSMPPSTTWSRRAPLRVA